jgi:hypothetical protein
MLKLVLFMKKRDDLTHEQFRTHYETSHALLAEKYLGKFMSDYRRSYVNPAASQETPNPGNDGFDVITEIWFKDQASLDAMWATMRQPDIAAEMVADGDSFRIRESLRYYVTDEYQRNPL